MPWFGRGTETVQESEVGSWNRQIFASSSRIRLIRFRWAKSHGFDLMLAGHNHGGQIRLPVFGALIAPSRYGFRYAAGLYLEPPTLLHVSRGLAGIHPIRLNCSPELALLILKTA